MYVFLTGFMGSGKSTVGLSLAKALDFDFWDLDELIQDQEGRTIMDIFKEDGQDYFRKLEHEIIKTLPDHLVGDAVISTGGGTPCYFDNADALNKLGTSFYLHLSSEILFERLVKESEGRPLLADLNDDDIRLKIANMIEVREPYYNMSTYKIDGNRSIKTIVQHILYLLNE